MLKANPIKLYEMNTAINLTFNTFTTDFREYKLDDTQVYKIES